MIEQHTHHNVRVLELADGRANFLSAPLRVALLDALVAADNDSTIASVVLLGSGTCFCAGMNLDDLDSGSALTSPSLHNEILDQLGAMSIPVVAAIHGAAHGGGLELALGCHYRVAHVDAQLSQPEILVGLFPGARGTQHLPRLIGIDAAAAMILTGQAVRAAAAPSGLIDHLIDGELDRDAFVAQAIDFAARVAELRALPRLQDKTVDASTADLTAIVPEAIRDHPGVAAAISLLQAASQLPYASAVKREFELFDQLAHSETSRPYREAFRAKLKADSQARRAARAAATNPKVAQ